MKPKMRFHNGVWFCKSTKFGIGIGTTIESSYWNMRRWEEEECCPVENYERSPWGYA